mgnify:CR=1 FL=1
MESQIIEKIEKPVQVKALPKLNGYYPFTQFKGRLVSTRVVGVTFEGRQEVVARLQMGDRIWLEMEPDNRYDPNAIKVCRSNGEQFGYLNRQLAADIVPYFQSYRYPVHGKVSLLTGSGWDGYSLGVIIVFKLPKPKRSNTYDNGPSFDAWDEWDN